MRPVAAKVGRYQTSSASTKEFIASADLQSLIGLQTSRQLSGNTGATMGLSMSLKDVSMILTNSWTRQRFESTDGNIDLPWSSGSSIAVGWRKKGERMSADGTIEIGASFVGASSQYIRHFSSKSHGLVAAKVGRYQTSSTSTKEFMASAGLQSLIGLQTFRQLSGNTGATMGFSMSLKYGSMILTYSWTRQLSESTDGNIELPWGSGSPIAIGWWKEGEPMSPDGAMKRKRLAVSYSFIFYPLQIGASSVGTSAQYIRHFSSKSYGLVAAKVGRYRTSSASTKEFMASAGLQSLIGLQTSWQISGNTGATMGLSMSLNDVSMILTNSWTQQLSESTDRNSSRLSSLLVQDHQSPLDGRRKAIESMQMER